MVPFMGIVILDERQCSDPALGLPSSDERSASGLVDQAMQQRPKRLVHIARERRAVGRIAHVVARSPVSNDGAGSRFALRTIGFDSKNLRDLLDRP